MFKIQYGQIYREQGQPTYGAYKQFKIQYGQIYSTPSRGGRVRLNGLKSNMDRFIARERDYTPQPRARLKSNMDRFIDLESGGTGYATKV